MGNRTTFVAGGAALGGHMRNALDATVQEVFADGSPRFLKRLSISNPGNALGHVKLFYEQMRWDLTFGGTIGDGPYSVLFYERSTDRLIATATVTRDAGTPADEAALAVAMETAIEDLVATDEALEGLIISADDDGVDGNLIIAERGANLRLETSAPTDATMTLAAVAPTIASAVPDMVFGVATVDTIDVELENLKVDRLWMAATVESGAGGTAPNADFVGVLQW